MDNALTYVLFAGVVLIAVSLTVLAWKNPFPPVSIGGGENSASNTAATAEPAASPQGLQVQDLVVGTGAEAKAGESITVDYEGTLTDGTVFDSSKTHGTPFTFVLGAGQVIQGWDQGVLGMKVGGKRKLVIPPELAYGSKGQGPIPPNATLSFTIDLLSVTPAK